jgi:hypothetical protein
MDKKALEDDFRTTAANLADHLADMSHEEPGKRRKHYIEILAILMLLRRRTSERLRRILRSSAIEEHAKLLLQLPATAALTESQLEGIISAAFPGAMGFLERSISGIHRLASSLLTDRTGIVLKSAVGVDKNSPDFRRRLRERLVSVLATDGRYRHYEPSYYAELVLVTTIGDLQKKIVRAQASNLSTDLVRIAGPDSKHGFCKAVLGRVFSISGTHSTYPSLAGLPNGGAPFHAFCSHYMVPVVAGDS